MAARTDSCDIAIVGGGLAGLVAASTAVDHGRRVTLFDPHPVGGRARSTSRRGWHLNQGAHALYVHGALARHLARRGIPAAGGNPAAFVSYGYRDGELGVLPTTIGSMARSSLLGVRSKLRLATMFARLGRLDPADHAGRTLRDWLSGEPDDLVAIIETLVRTTTFTHAPDDIDAGAVIAQLQLAMAGVRYLDRGWQQIVDALTATSVRRGLQLRTDEVTSIDGDSSGATVRSTMGTLRAGAVIIAAGGPEIETRLLGTSKLDVGPRVEAVCLDLLLEEPAPRAGAFGVGTPHYITPHSAVAALAPEGCGLMSGIHYLAPNEEPGDPAAEQAAIIHLATAVGLRETAIVDRRYLHRVTVSHSFPSACRGGLAGRPGPRTDVAGVFRAGDWVGPIGVLADASAASGEAAAHLAAAHLAVAPRDGISA